MDGGRYEWSEGEMERARDGGMDGGRDGLMDDGREAGREGGREGNQHKAASQPLRDSWNL
jgi:hypothetical protein